MMEDKRFKVVPGVALIIERDGKTLLIQRGQNCSFPGTYCNIGGHVDGNETIREAAAREAWEEVGIKVRPEDMQFMHVIHRYDARGEIITFFFKTTKFEGEPFNKEPEKHTRIVWAPLDNLPEPLFPTLRCYLENKDQCYSEFEWDLKK
jgi:8-oxo-dGTP diphosphatase